MACRRTSVLLPPLLQQLTEGLGSFGSKTPPKVCFLHPTTWCGGPYYNLFFEAFPPTLPSILSVLFPSSSLQQQAIVLKNDSPVPLVFSLPPLSTTFSSGCVKPIEAKVEKGFPMIARNFFLGVCGGISVLSPWVGEVIIFSLSLASPLLFFASSFCCSLLSCLRLG